MKISNMIPRNSTFELMRILSQCYIILYHICFAWNSNSLSGDPFFRAIGPTLHIGVIVFVLLSGFFMIKPSSKGLIKFLSIFIFYRLIEIFSGYVYSGDILIKNALILSTSHWWFIKTYLFLYLVSPMLNIWLKNANSNQRWYMLVALGFVVEYMALSKGDPSMTNGKNVTNFIFLYLVGNQLKYCQDKWEKLSWKSLFFCYVTLNLISFSSIYLLHGTIFAKAFFYLSFQYSSPILLLNSILFFMIIGKCRIQSNVINYLASSSLAIYLIHGMRPYCPILHNYVTDYFQTITNNVLFLFGMYIIYTILILFVCIMIDKLISQGWKLIARLMESICFKFKLILGYVRI